MRTCKILFNCCLILLSGTLSISAVAQTAQEEFGINRVQYKDFIWSFYTADRYMVYYYLGGQELGKFIVMDAPGQMQEIEKFLEYRLQDPIDIMVYNNLSDLKQSNIGRAQDILNTGGITRIIGNKIFIYFDGDHQHLRNQLRSGIAKLCLQNMMYGGSVQEVLQNAVLLNLPLWYTNGLAAYAGQGWTPENEAVLRDYILNGTFKNLNKITPEHATLAGQSFWNYIAAVYGKTSIPNVLYLTRINHNVEAGFSYVIGKSFKDVMAEWYDYYRNYYQKANAELNSDIGDRIKVKMKKNQDYHHFTLNTTASQMAYVLNDAGLYKVYVHDLETNRRKKIVKGGYRDQTMPVDKSFPMLAWDNSGNNLAVLHEKKTKPQLMVYEIDTKKKTQKTIINFQKIQSLCFGEGSNQLVMSAVNRGQSDIYTYNIASSKVTQITNDFWDDVNPQYIKLHNRQGILFLSNRISDTIKVQKTIDSLLPVNSLDLYFYNTKTQSKALVQVSQTPNYNENAPIPFNSKYFGYLTIKNNVSNRYIAYIDSVFHHYDYYYYFPDSTAINPRYNIDSLRQLQQWKPDSTARVPVFKDVSHSFSETDNQVGMMDQCVALRKGIIVEQYMIKGKPVFIKKVIPQTVNPGKEILFQQEQAMPIENVNEPKKSVPENEMPPQDTVPLIDTVDRNKTIDFNNYQFQNEFTLNPNQNNNKPNSSVEPIIKPIVVNPVEGKSKSTGGVFKFGKILPYTVKFSTDYLAGQLDNTLLINRYQSYNTNAGQFQNPNLGALMKLGITDLFEDYRITGGFRLPTNITGSEYFISFEDFKKRLDKKYTYYRRTQNRAFDFPGQWFLPVNTKIKTNYAEASLRYPLDYNRSFRGNISYRNEQAVYLSTDTFSLNRPSYDENWASIRGEYVFDNTRRIQLNILSGTRYKIYADAQKLLDRKNFFMYALGIDYRSYKPIHRQIIWANRVNAATSWGSARVAYLLGGVENWLIPRINNDTNSSDETIYGFMTLANNMRGFAQSSRKGNSTIVYNTEVRFPVFSYVSNAPIRSEFVKNFQLITFLDIGTSWLGFSPYSEDNPFNTKVFERNPVTVKVNYFREPVLFGTGLGARTTLFGYFVRVDYASGFDSGQWQKPIWHLSIGTDF